MRRLTVLTVAYPFAPVGPDAVGGAEQVAAALDAALIAAGHRSIVVACAGSRVAGALRAIELPAGTIDDSLRARVHGAVREAVAAALPAADVVHLHGIDFTCYLPPPGRPLLATLHLPPDWYPAEAFRSGVHLQCVSAHQHAHCPPCATLLPPIGNGVDLAALAARHARRDFLLMLGRICPEKGQHLALRAAHAADAALLIAGDAFPYPAHRAYLDGAVRPALDSRRRWIGPVGFARKRRLLSAARGVLIPSLCAETSSLVAMEAAACGTPVIAFRAGALPEIVRDGVTGFVVDDWPAMAAAICRLDTIDPAACRAEARARFDVRDMVAAQFARYAALAA